MKNTCNNGKRKAKTDIKEFNRTILRHCATIYGRSRKRNNILNSETKFLMSVGKNVQKI